MLLKWKTLERNRIKCFYTIALIFDWHWYFTNCIYPMSYDNILSSAYQVILYHFFAFAKNATEMNYIAKHLNKDTF